MFERAAARAGLYRLLSVAFDYPRGELRDALRSGEYQDAVAASARAAGIAGDLPAFDSMDENLEATYLQIFEFGRDGVRPCALREGAHINLKIDDGFLGDDGRCPSLVEDLLRFYHYFGLRLSDDPVHRLPPDHLVCQLEMLSHLSALESNRERSDEIAIGYRDAQRDFLRRHVAAWFPKVHHELARIDKQDAFTRFYVAVTDLTLAGVVAHLTCVSQPPGKTAAG